MKIQKIELRRFKSIREVILPQSNGDQTLDNLIILIGRNSSGKTNLLEAIDYFFKEFDPAFERAIGAVNPELWHGRNTYSPIEWDITLKLERDEPLAVFGKDFMPLFDAVADKDRLKILRKIIATPQDMRWQTTELRIGNIDFIKDAKAITPEEISQALPRPETIQSNLVPTILASLTTLLRTQFKYVSCARDNVQSPPSFGNRAPIINPTTLNSINTLAQGTAAEIRGKWSPLRIKMENSLPSHERIDSKTGQLFLENEPFPATGGGAQSVLAIIHEVETGSPIVAIEEPENHLHPELVKKMLRYFQEISNGATAQQVFVSTHSPFMIDSSQIQGIVSLYRDEQETRARQIGTKKELKAALFDIGARPSDLFFSDLVLIVEGESDKVAFQNWSRTLGIPLEDIHAAVIPCKGISKARYHLKLWLETSKEVGLPTYAMVDNSGADELAKAISEKLIDEDKTHVLEKGDLEDYYPINTLMNALQELFSVTATEDKLPNTGRAKAIAKLVGKNDEEWKVPLAEQVSKTTGLRYVPREIADFLRRMHGENISR